MSFFSSFFFFWLPPTFTLIFLLLSRSLLSHLAHGLVLGRELRLPVRQNAQLLLGALSQVAADISRAHAHLGERPRALFARKCRVPSPRAVKASTRGHVVDRSLDRQVDGPEGVPAVVLGELVRRDLPDLHPAAHRVEVERRLPRGESARDELDQGGGEEDRGGGGPEVLLGEVEQGGEVHLLFFKVF